VPLFVYTFLSCLHLTHDNSTTELLLMQVYKYKLPCLNACNFSSVYSCELSLVGNTFEARWKFQNLLSSHRDTITDATITEIVDDSDSDEFKISEDEYNLEPIYVSPSISNKENKEISPLHLEFERGQTRK
jgi:hypothetical protein